MTIAVARAVDTFPGVTLPSHSGGLPVEVALIAQLGVGAGDPLIHGASARQRSHSAFVDALDEPSARIAGLDLEKGDASSLYTFTVGSGGHAFHCHAGQRMFTAVSGSSGARLRFCTASAAQVQRDPQEFVRALRQVTIPPDCVFTVRFGGGTWHQFLPLRPNSGHPALFALSCHANELGGELAEDLQARVIANSADIPSLTELLPPAIDQLLAATNDNCVPSVALSLHSSPRSAASRMCASARSAMGRVRSLLVQRRSQRGFVAEPVTGRYPALPADPLGESLLQTQLAESFNHEDSVCVTLQQSELGTTSASALLAAVLDGLLANRPAGVSRLMALRNALVRPLRLRTSPLGCPASSLLSPCSPQTFAGRFPVLARREDAAGTQAEVILGADDRHLRFRSCVSVRVGAEGTAVVTLGTRVQTLNRFGRLYMRLVDPLHRGYIAPTMLRLAVEHAMRHRTWRT